MSNGLSGDIMVEKREEMSLTATDILKGISKAVKKILSESETF